jgi:hypothetical protein
VPRAAVGADDDLALELRAKLATPEFKGAGGDKFEVVEVGVNVEDFHAAVRPAACVDDADESSGSANAGSANATASWTAAAKRSGAAALGNNWRRAFTGGL